MEKGGSGWQLLPRNSGSVEHGIQGVSQEKLFEEARWRAKAPATRSGAESSGEEVSQIGFPEDHSVDGVTQWPANPSPMGHSTGHISAPTQQRPSPAERAEPNGSAELGDAYRDAAEAYEGVLCFDKALPLCLKALEIAEKRSGEGSAEAAKVRRILVVAYTGMGRNEEALEQNELVRMEYERLGLDAELSLVEIDGASLRILLGRTEDAMNDLKKVMKRASKESEERALAFVAMAKILCSEDRSSDSTRCLEIARETLDAKRSVNTERVAGAYTEISMLYESMNEFEMSLCLMKKTLAFLEGASGMQHIQGSISARMGFLLLLTKRIDESVPFLEKAIEKLKNCFGPLHFGLGFAYKHLGEAYIEMGQPESSLKFFGLASDIINAAFGPKHEDSIEIIQCIANAYGLMGSYKYAMDFQQRVIDAYESCGPGSAYEIREAHRLLEQIRKKAEGSPSAVFPANSLPVLPENR
uniref:Nephrocystin-3 n=1 Tax=Aegilops tauschii TaxID=37682 RepID=M8BZN9_AEGTA